MLCIDEKSQVQALDRTPDPADHARGPEKQSHDYVRNDTTVLFAALEVASGRVEQWCLPRHRHQEFLRFLKQVAKAYPRVTLHLVCDSYATHKHPAITAWLARNPRITLHFTPTSGSWLNMVEIIFRIITRQAIRRGTFARSHHRVYRRVERTLPTIRLDQRRHHHHDDTRHQCVLATLSSSRSVQRTIRLGNRALPSWRQIRHTRITHIE